MRLLVDMHCFDYATTEGVNTHLNGLYSEAIKLPGDIEFYFAACDISKIKKIFGERPNVSYVELKSRNRYYRLLREYTRIIKKYGIDKAHFQYTVPLICNCEMIVTLHDVLFLDFPHYFPLSYRLSKSLLFRRSARKAAHLFTVSEYSRERIALHYGIDERTIHITPNAVDPSFYDISAERAKEYVGSMGINKYILYVSRIEPRKNQHKLLEAYLAADLWKQGYNLVFIGRPTIPSPAFEARIESLEPDVRRHVHVLSQVGFDELKYWYKAASLFVYPAGCEGFGIPPIEAAAAGIPCVCSNATAMGDFRFFGDNLIDVSDDRRLREAIIEALNSTRSETVMEVQRAVRERFNWEKIANDFIKTITAEGEL